MYPSSPFCFSGPGLVRLSVLLTIVFAGILAPVSISATDFTVTNNADSGVGSLRQAILDSNATGGLDTVVFSIGSGVQTISLTSSLPAITDPVVVDGTTQPGYVSSPLIFINGAGVSGIASGLTITGGGSTVRGLAVGNFSNGAGISISTTGGNVIQGNYIGVDTSGTLRRANSYGLTIFASNNNLIGGTVGSERNVISGSTFTNVSVGGGSASNNLIKGNYIGTNAAGTAAIETGGFGVEISNGPDADNVIGGAEPGAGNLISGNGQYGVQARGNRTLIQGNLIGTNATGTQAVPNFSGGVQIVGSDILVGGTAPAARNIISGNGGRGVHYSESFVTAISRIQGNYIGVDITGTSVLGNGIAGIEVDGNIQIGGTEAGAGNVISGNGGRGGIYLRTAGSLGVTKIEGNLIGTDAAGNAALGNAGHPGIEVGSNNNFIGGNTPGARNVIAGNVVGIQIGGSTTATIQNNTIQGNFIGTSVNGSPLPNSVAGVRISAGSNNKIGGPNPGEGNVIAFNQGPGVAVTGSFDAAAGNSIRRNSTFANSGLGIDLGPAGRTPNDNCDSDSGPNNLQNSPVLSSVVSNNAHVVMSGTLNAAPNTTYTIDIFENHSLEAPGNGQGRLIYLASTQITTNGECNATISSTINGLNLGGLFYTATATDPAGNTSEFSLPTRASGTRGPAAFDFDGDWRTDIGIFRPSTGEWWIRRSSNGAVFATQFGSASDQIVPGDYTGDGKMDVAVWRPSSGDWLVLRSDDFSFYAFPFGSSGDVPVPSDYDADGKTDAAVFRPSSSTWYIRRSSDGGTSIEAFGTTGDQPVPSDYDGDGKADIAIHRPSSGQWWLNRSTLGIVALNFGVATDKPVPGDYTGDGKSDIAFWRDSTGEWYILRSEDFSYFSVPFGTSGDIPTPGDYDIDGKLDITVFRPSAATWFVRRSTAGVLIQQFGAIGDRPIPSSHGR